MQTIVSKWPPVTPPLAGGSRRMPSARITFLLVGAVLATVALLGFAASAQAAPIWNVESEARPTAFQASDDVGNDEYGIEVENLGGASEGLITMVDHLPPGVSTTSTPVGEQNHQSRFYLEHGLPYGEWTCSEGAGQTVVTCTMPAVVASVAAPYNFPTPQISQSALDPINIPVMVAGGTTAEIATNTVTVSGGGALSSALSNNTNPINSGADTTFGTSSLNVRAIGPDGESFTRTAGHPYAVTTDFAFNQEIKPGESQAARLEERYRNVVTEEEARTIVAELPLGLVGDPQATPRCSQQQFFENSADNRSACPADTRVGVAFLNIPGLIGPYQVMNLEPAAGHAAEFGFRYLGVPVVLFGDVVRSDRGYVLRITALIPQAHVSAISLTFFGDPAATFETDDKATAFLTNPADCIAGSEARSLQLHIDTWTNPGIGDPFNGDFSDSAWVPANATLPPVEGCGSLKFNPSLSFAPSSAAEGGIKGPDEPSGYNVNLEVLQTESYSELATPELKTATVTLPEGVSVSPSAANGLQACSNVQIALESKEPASCPLSSQVGTVKITTPLLEEALEGEVFLGEPECGAGGVCTDGDASEGRIFRLFIQVHSEKLGITIKLPGTVEANPSTGQLTAIFKENPEIPFSNLELHFKNGPRAPLANPQTCGTFTTVSDLEPWSAPGTPTAVSQSPFAITGCSSSLPFAPAFSAGTVSPAAGAYSPFSVTFSRNDDEQDLGAIAVTTPPGLLGRIAGIPRCGEAQANASTCSAASQIGTTTVTAGPGSDPYTISGGRVYLTEPYKGGPFGLSIVVPAVAGPFDLGDVVVRASIAVNPTTAALTIMSNPLPQIVDGVPIRLRSATVEVNREDFIFNATNCASQHVEAMISGLEGFTATHGSSMAVSNPYSASGCAGLAFKPSLTVSAQGKVSKVDGASLVVRVSQKAGEANIHGVDLTLPKALPARLTTLQKACAEAQFNANPAGCPEASDIGMATAVTPLLNVPLKGPAYLVSHGGAAFPDVEFVLQGEGVEIVLDGKTDIKKGITYSKFETVPDAPISSFEAVLSEGPHSILGTDIPATAKYNLCAQKLVIPATVMGQSGELVTQQTKVAVTGCAKAKALTRTQKLAKALKACRQEHKHSKKRRAGCEKRARKKYGGEHKHTAKNGKAYGKGRK